MPCLLLHAEGRHNPPMNILNLFRFVMPLQQRSPASTHSDGSLIWNWKQAWLPRTGSSLYENRLTVQRLTCAEGWQCKVADGI